MSIFKGWDFRSWLAFAVLWFVAYGVTAWVGRPASAPGKIVVLALAAGIAGLIVHALNSRAERARLIRLTTADSPRVADPGPVLSAWQQLGSDPQEREAAINQMFDGRIGVVEFDTMWDFEYSHQHSLGSTETAYSSMSFHIARDLATLDSRESEFLRATYLLYNAGEIDEQTWNDLTFCYVYGEGKAAIVSCEYREPVALPFSDGPGAIRYYSDAHHATIYNAAAKLLAIIDMHAQKAEVPPVVQALMSRLQDDG